MKRAKAREPRRVLVPVGGAGAQKKFITELTERVAPLCKSGTVKLVLNAGDHADLRASLLETLAALGFAEGGDLKVIGDHAGVVALQRSQDFAPVTLLAFSDYFAAVAATDLLVPVVDVLACKPSELAFYPVPKLMIRRVGDHEAFSASRANELGDGTEEVLVLVVVLVLVLVVPVLVLVVLVLVLVVLVLVLVGLVLVLGLARRSTR